MATSHSSFWLILGCLLCVSVTIGKDERETCSKGDCQSEHDEVEEVAKYQKPTDTADDLKPCPSPPPKLGPLTVDVQAHPIDWVLAQHVEVRNGGTWQPADCRPKQKVAILVPYRDREEDLRIFLHNIHPFLRVQLLEYTVYLIEQMDKKHFNRAVLLNIGYAEAMKQKKYDCIILHDIDKFPENTHNLYTCGDKPVHMISRVRYVGQEYRNTEKYFYKEYFGGVTAIAPRQFQQINGFSNMFWGWGSEDDDLYKRMHFHGLETTRAAEDYGTYMEIWHPYGFVNPRRHEVVREGISRYHTDGLNSLNYKLLSVQSKPLYTNISVILLDTDPYAGK